MAGTTTKDISWENEVADAEGVRNKELSYEFSNGRKFMEPFDPEGTGIYEDEEA